MDFAFFEGIGQTEAREFLDNYKREGEAHVDEFRSFAGIQDLPRYTLSTLPTAFEAVARAVIFEPVGTSEPEPAWVRSSPSWGNGPTELNNPSKILVLRLSYYLAETLRQTFGDRVTWSVGDPESAEQQQPVLDGFVNGVQLSPLLVTENLVRKLAERTVSVEAELDRTVAAWTSLLRR